MFKLLVTLSLVLASSLAQANWLVDTNHSNVSFVSIKKNTIAEAHHFNQFSGDMSSTGQFVFNIDLSSVETGIPIRNQRMIQYLFETKKFTDAKITAQLDPKLIAQLAVSNSMTQQIKAVLNLHGVSKELTFEVVITKTASDRVLVSTIKPIIINAGDFMLTAGIDKLRDLASLPQISYAVPVSFNLQLIKLTLR